jgi:hypothetical protein
METEVAILRHLGLSVSQTVSLHADLHDWDNMLCYRRII